MSRAYSRKSGTSIASQLSKSSNALWYRNNKSKDKSTNEKHKKNNATSPRNDKMKLSYSRHFKTFRKSVIQHFKHANKPKQLTMNDRCIIHERKNMNAIKHTKHSDYCLVDISDNIPTNFNSSSPIQNVCQNSLHNSNTDDNELNQKNTLELPPISSALTTEQQNINATHDKRQTIQETFQTAKNQLSSSTRTPVTSQQEHSANKRKNPTRRITDSSKRKNPSKRKRIVIRKLSSKSTLSKRNHIPVSKVKNSTGSLPNSTVRLKADSKQIVHAQCPFPNPTIFRSIPKMQNSDEITKDNVCENHLCCKPITSVKGLSTNDKTKLINHAHLTLTSLLPIYLDSQNNFQQIIREKTNISVDGALELDRLINQWSSARLFIGANSHYKTLSQEV